MTRTCVRAEYWESKLNSCLDGEMTEIVEEACTELNSLFPYIGRDVLISGPGMITDNEQPGWIDMNLGYFDVFGSHKGIAIITLKEGVIAAQKIAAWDGTYYFNIDTDLLADDEKKECLMDDNERLTSLYDTSEKIRNLLGSNLFFGFPAANRRRALQKLLAISEQETQIYGLNIVAGPVVFYANEYDRLKEYRSGYGLDLSGRCIGLETLHTQVFAPGADKSERNAAAGLCIVVDPNESPRRYYGLGERQSVLLPLGLNSESTLAVGS